MQKISTISQNYEQLDAQLKDKNYNITDLIVNQETNKTIIQNKRKLDAISANIEARISKYKNEVLENPENPKSRNLDQLSPEEKNQTIKKAKRIELAGKIALCSAAAFGLLAWISLCIPGGVAMTIPGMLPFGAGIALIGTSISSAILGIITATTSAILLNSSVLREKRALTSKNFADFIKEFHLKGQDVSSVKIQNIYLDWKNQIKSI